MRIAIMSDVGAATPRLLSDATIAAAEARGDAVVCGFVTSSPDALLPSRAARARRLGVDVIRRAAGTGGALGRFDLGRLSRRHDLPVLVTHDPSDARFLERLHAELAPTVLLSYYCLSVLRPALLGSVEQAINYHDGELPARAGLGATYHSVYEGDATSGFVFHRMDAAIDAGPILLEGAVPVRSGDTGDEVHRRKAEAAARLIPDLLDLIATSAPGTRQAGARGYRSADDAAVLTDIADPTSVSRSELEHRIRAFGGIAVDIDGGVEYVTALTSADRGDPLSFECADGWVRAAAIAGLPTGLIRLRRRLRR